MSHFLLVWLTACTIALVLASPVVKHVDKTLQRVSVPLSHRNPQSANGKRSVTSLRPRGLSGLRKRHPSSSSVPITDEGLDYEYYLSVNIGSPRKFGHTNTHWWTGDTDQRFVLGDSV